MSPPLILFDDAVARRWHPFTTTRPAGELLFGIATLRSRAEYALGLECAGHLAAPELAGYHEPWAPPVLDTDALDGDGPDGPDSAAAAFADANALDDSEGLVFLSSRFVAEPSSLPDQPALLVAGDRVVGCRLGPGQVPPVAFLSDPDGSLSSDPAGTDTGSAGSAAVRDLPRHPVDGRLVEHVWALMSGNADRVARDLADADHAALPPDVHHIGDGPVSVGEGVEIAPGVVLDTRHGPIRLDDDVTVQPFTRLAGPAYVGPGSTLLGGPFEAVSIGPVCKVHGEIEASVILGYSNKAHDGFLGHAYLGMWVNLGALTTNSDLKNNYGTVRVWTPGGDVDTGSRKIGCFLGDHVKTAIGTLFNTGTVVGTGANVFPVPDAGDGRPSPAMPPKYLPPFAWGRADTAYGLDRFLDTARTVMGRRDVELTESQRDMLTRVWEAERG
jgi:UDP-N-acetylglucosamine diphosphorylase/glucosamine-1-phosphate N-acetyltransferase